MNGETKSASDQFIDWQNSEPLTYLPQNGNDKDIPTYPKQIIYPATPEEMQADFERGFLQPPQWMSPQEQQEWVQRKLKEQQEWRQRVIPETVQPSPTATPTPQPTPTEEEREIFKMLPRGSLDTIYKTQEMTNRPMNGNGNTSPASLQLTKQNGNGNVIIPETGAAKYWYVDPKAKAYGPQGFNPATAQMPAAATASASNAQEMARQQSLEEEAKHWEALYQKKLEEWSDRKESYEPDQATQISYRLMASSPGVVTPPTRDLETDAYFSIQEDGNTYWIAQEAGQTPEEAKQHFIETGEHLGRFQDQQAADFFAQNWLK